MLMLTLVMVLLFSAVHSAVVRSVTGDLISVFQFLFASCQSGSLSTGGGGTQPLLVVRPHPAGLRLLPGQGNQGMVRRERCLILHFTANQIMKPVLILRFFFSKYILQYISKQVLLIYVCYIK